MASNSSTVALVTGASSGIGESLARCFAQPGTTWCWWRAAPTSCRRWPPRCRPSMGVKAWVEPADLAQPGAATLAATLRRKRRRMDVLVNNAGVLEQGPFVGIDASGEAMPAADRPEHQRPDRLLDELLPAMVARGIGPGAERGVDRQRSSRCPPLATYAATKAYVLSLTESLSEELRGTGVTITALCPGITATHMLGQGAPARQRRAQRSCRRFWWAMCTTWPARALRPACAATVICVPGVVNRAAMVASRSTPKWLVRRIGG
jgi:short-subunit dehydrogenase